MFSTNPLFIATFPACVADQTYAEARAEGVPEAEARHAVYEAMYMAALQAVVRASKQAPGCVTFRN